MLTSGAMDFAKMLQIMGVDRVIAVDLQRPGQGHEACFFDNTVPLESVVTTDYLVNYFIKSVPLQAPIVVVAPNSECMKKARKFQLAFQDTFGVDAVKLAAFSTGDTGSGPSDTDTLELLTNPKVRQRLRHAIRVVYLYTSHVHTCCDNGIRRLDRGSGRRHR
jgi:hypothetical protein